MKTSDIPDNELLLARSAAIKLEKLLSGFLSVGLGALQLDSPERFWNGRTGLISAILEVLRQTGVRPGTDTARELKTLTACLSTRTDQFMESLASLLHWRQLPLSAIDRTATELSTGYFAALETLQALLQGLGADFDLAQRRHEATELIAAARRELQKAHVTLVG